MSEGERSGWPYLIITRMHGVVGAEARPGYPRIKRRAS
jgi:hypothetical protein